MPQQTSPFIEGKYGWSYGESGWNPGMDENLNKFSFMFDANVDTIVNSLPAAVNGQAHFLTTDNRFYFAVGGIYYSSPCPDHFIFKLRSTGDFYQFNGSSAVQIDSPIALDARLDAIELTISTLGTAAFEDVANLATQAELDVASAQANAYTDDLRTDIGSTASLLQGTYLIGKSILQFQTRVEIRSVAGRYDGDMCHLLGAEFSDPSLIAGDFRWDATSTSADNNGTVYAVAGVSTGRWIRVFEGSAMVSWFWDGDIGGNWVPTMHLAQAAHDDITINRPVGVIPPMTWNSGKTVRGVQGAIVTALSTGPHIMSNASSATDVTIIGVELDGDNIPGLNGFGMGTIEALPTSGELRVIDCTVRNCKRSPTLGGGRAFTCQGNTNGMIFHNPRAFDCTTGFDMSGGTGLGVLIGAQITGVAYAENCQEAVSVYSDSTATSSTVPPTNPEKVITTYDMVFARNCGRTTDTSLYSGTGSPSDQDGGVIVMRRGRNTTIKHLTVYNDTTYTAGAILRGTGGNVHIQGMEVWGNFTSVVWNGSADNLLPLPSTNDATYGCSVRGRYHGNSTNILKQNIATGNNFYTGCYIDVDVDSFSTTNSIIVSATGTMGTNNEIRVKDLRNARKLRGNTSSVLTNINTLTLAAFENSVAEVEKHFGDIQLNAGAVIDYTTTFGAAGALVGYIQIKVGGTVYKVPYYAVS